MYLFSGRFILPLAFPEELVPDVDCEDRICLFPRRVTEMSLLQL